ncbi:MAG: xanthine dehydrogenase family protein subunit M [Rhodopseudomonas sp.]|nr:xanthine dehydrogenase family protein subunit M [Rhodopseudomonas sp.]
MIPFEMLEPKSLRDATALLDADDPTIRPLGGGTALMLMMKAGVFQPSRLVSLRSVEPRYSTITVNSDGSFNIGALAPLASLEHSADIHKHLPVITRTMQVLSNVRVRNVATIGGCLAHGDPHMDLPPVLISLGAKVRVIGPDSERTIPVADLLTGYYETQLAKNELIAELIIPPQNGKRSVYLKCTTRAAHDWPALGVAVSVAGNRDGLSEAHVVISAATERAQRVEQASALLVGPPANDKLFKDAGEAAASAVELIGDSQGSVPYKRQLVRVFVERALRQAIDGGITQ